MSANDDIFVWRGFDHDWLRTVAGFRTPHRVSKLHSFVSTEGGRAQFAFGQATGVDGNYMRPVGHYAVLRAPGVGSVQRSVTLAWTDEVDGGRYPQACSDRGAELSVDLADAFLGRVPEQHAVVLSGFQLQSRCDPQKQPADNPRNSDGMWPFKLGVWLGEPVREGTTLRCPVNVHVYRAWTPMLGGLPPFEIKPLNARLDIEVTVMVTVVAGDEGALRVTRGPEVGASTSARSTREVDIDATVRGVRERYPHAVSALHGFGFELLRSSRLPMHGHLGRYLNNLRFRVEDGAYDSQRGVLEVAHRAQVWVPSTVVPTDVRCTLGSTLLQLGPGARVRTNQQVRGQLCSNSTDQAPFFSRWCECGDHEHGPDQSEARVCLPALD